MWVLFLSLIAMLGRAVISNVMFRFVEEDGVRGSCPSEKTRSHYPNNSPVPTSSRLVDWYRGYGTTTPCAPRP
jgi:hypothetical protein